MPLSTLHVVFGPSGAGSLRQALVKAERQDMVTSMFDDLTFGPINPSDLSSRGAWVERELGWTGWIDIAAASDSFWQEALSPGRRKIAWLSRRSTKEYAGFLEWLWRLGDDPCEIIDLTHLKTSLRSEHGQPTREFPIISLGVTSPDTIVDNDLLGHATLLPTASRREYQGLWKQLRAENAPLRVLRDGKLLSAPISFFDSRLMNYSSNDWQKVACIIGLTLASQMNDNLFQAGDIFLAARVDALAAAGRLELRGKSALDMHASEVRLPARP